jgi:hypothetical protein
LKKHIIVSIKLIFMDTYQNYDTTNMTPDDIMKLFKQIEWNEVKKKSIQRLKKTHFEKKEEIIKNWNMWTSPLFL